MTRRDSNKVARNILQGRPYENLSIAIKKFERIALMFGLASLFFLVISFFKENRLYLPYVICSFLQIGAILIGSYLFKKFRRLKWLLIIVLGYFLLYLVERFFFGALVEPLIGIRPTIVRGSPGLAKVIAMMLPTFYVWTKVIFGVIWVFIFLLGLRLKNLKF